MTIEVYIKQPPSSRYPYTGSPATHQWIPLNTERIDYDINSDAEMNAITSDETVLIDLTASVIQMLITGVMSGATATADMWQLITCAREWKFAGDLNPYDIDTLATVKWRAHEEAMGVHRLTFIEQAETDANALEYLLTLNIRTVPRSV